MLAWQGGDRVGCLSWQKAAARAGCHGGGEVLRWGGRRPPRGLARLAAGEAGTAARAA